MKLRLDDVKLTIHPEARLCVERGHQPIVLSESLRTRLREQMGPTALLHPLEWGDITITHIYRAAASHLSRDWYDGGQAADDMLWVYLNNPKLRGIYPGIDDSEKLFEYLTMFEVHSSLGQLVIDDKGRHHILKWRHADANFHVDLQLVDNVMLVGDFGVMDVDSFQRSVISQVQQQTFSQIKEILDVSAYKRSVP